MTHEHHDNSHDKKLQNNDPSKKRSYNLYQNEFEII